MLTTQELNFYSHLVVTPKGQEVGQIHFEPSSAWDTQPWKAYINGELVHQSDSFMRCFRHIQQHYKAGVYVAV